MGQTWNTLVVSDTLEDSMPDINTNYETLRSCFSGSSAPGSGIAGQLFYNSSTDILYIYNGSSWYQLFAGASAPYCGMLPRTNTTSYPMGDHLYMGTKQIKNMAAATVNTDGATLADIKTYIDAHVHEDATGGGAKVHCFDALKSDNETDYLIMQTGDDDEVVPRNVGLDGTNGTEAISHVSMTTVATVDVYVYAGETKYVFVGMELIGDPDGGTTAWQVQRDSTDLMPSAAVGASDHPEVCYFVVADTGVVSDNTYTYHIDCQKSGSGSSVTARLPYIFVI